MDRGRFGRRDLGFGRAGFAEKKRPFAESRLVRAGGLLPARYLRAMLRRLLVRPARLRWGEGLFFLALFVLLPLLSDVEFALNEAPAGGLSWSLLLQRLVYGLLSWPPYGLYYVLVLPLLLRARYGWFGFWTLAFFGGLSVYTHYILYGLIQYLPFLPTSLSQAAARYQQAQPWLHVSVVYVMRELLVLTTLAYYRHAASQQQQLQALRQQQLQAELSQLKEHLQPHFFFNTLNSIYSLALQQSPHTAPLVAQHADIMRHMLYYAQAPTVAVAQEVAFLRNYLAVEAVRYAPTHAISFDTQGQSAGAVIAPLLLLPFLENAFKHGLQPALSPGYVHVLLVLFEQELVLEVRNSIPPAGTPSTPTLGGGLGLATVTKRLALLYPQRHTLEISEEATAYSVRLSFRLAG